MNDDKVIINSENVYNKNTLLMIEFQLYLFHSAEKIIPRILGESSPFLRSTTSLSHNFGQCKKNVMVASSV